MSKANPPEYCDICEKALKRFTSYFDAAVPGYPYYGLWAWACQGCVQVHNIKVGLGLGQEYSSETDEKIRG